MADPNLNIIDRFMEAFSHYIDSGFGLLGPDVSFLTTILIGIDITLAGLWWAMDGDSDILGRLIKKILYVGVFALILTQYQHLADVIYRSFAGLGIKAGGGGLTADDLLHPGALAAIGFKSAHPLFDYASSLLGFPEVFGNLLNIAALLIGWIIVVLAFFILAVQLFISVLEFKLTALAGFVLVPFALWNKTSFLAERVLGNVISSGLKVMVLAVIVGIGTNFFAQSVAALPAEPTMADTMTLVLGALALFGLGIFGPSIAAGLVTGAPQLGAGAAAGTVAGAALAVGGGALLGARAAMAAGSGGMAALRAGTAMGSAAATAFQAGRTASSASGGVGVAAGLSGVASAAGGATMQGARALASRVAQPFKDSAEHGRQAAQSAMGGTADSAGAAPAPASADSANGSPGGGSSAGDVSNSAPAWARKLRAEQTARHHRQAALQHIHEGDRPMGEAQPDLSHKED